MSGPSKWPLSGTSKRAVSPVVIRQQLKQHPLAQDCYPLAVGNYEKASDHYMSRGRHDDNLLIYCYAGTGFLEAGDYKGRVSAGEVVVLPAGVNHRYWADSDDPWSIYWMHFSGTQAKSFILNMDYSEQQPVTFIGYSPLLMAQFKETLDAASNAFNTKALVYAANGFKQILTHVAKLMDDVSEQRSRGIDVDRVQALMLQNLNEPLSLGFLADQANLSKYHFCKKYKTQTGYSPIQHFLKMKMEYACYLLETSDSSVKEIAAKVGYQDALYFSRLFKKMMAVSPQAYRKCF